jgi:hypothetical protein
MWITAGRLDLRWVPQLAPHGLHRIWQPARRRMRTPETPPPYDVGAVHEGSYSCHLRLLVAFGQHIPGVLRVGQFAIAVRPTQARCNHHFFSGEISRVGGVETFCSLPDPELELCVLRARSYHCTAAEEMHTYICDVNWYVSVSGSASKSDFAALNCSLLLSSRFQICCLPWNGNRRVLYTMGLDVERSHVLFPIPDNAPSDHASRRT